MTARQTASGGTPVSPQLPLASGPGGDKQMRIVAPVTISDDGEQPMENQEELAEEAEELKTVRDPMLPSPEEIEAHRRSHIPYRAWCKFCVMGRCMGAGHKTSEHKSRIPVIGVDYFFVTAGDVKARKDLEYP